MRAQTTLDFAIAMGVFLFAVAFVFMFIPSLVGPFSDGNQENPVSSDRIASHLSEGGLGDPNTPYILNETCSTAFFGESNPGIECGYDTSTTDHRTRAAVSELQGFQVEIARIDPATGDRTTLCEDGSGTVGTADVHSCSTDYVVGDDPTSADSVTVARRVVTFPAAECAFDSCDATMLVRVW